MSWSFYTSSGIETSQVGLRGSNGEGVPSGGGAGALLSKKTNTNYDTEWLPFESLNIIKKLSGLTLLDTQTFTSSTTYTMPTGAELLIIKAFCAGGGGGGGGNNTILLTGGGGAGGAIYQDIIDSRYETLPTGSVTVTIGAGGSGGGGDNIFGGRGSDGGTTRFGPRWYPGASGGSGAANVSGSSNFYALFNEAFSIGARGAIGRGGAGNAAGNKGVDMIGGAAGGGGSGEATAGGSFETDPAVGINATGGGGAAGGGAGDASQGGGGGMTSSSISLRNGGAGGAPGGGGGGGGRRDTTSNGGSGGSGARGEIKIWVYG